MSTKDINFYVSDRFECILFSTKKQKELGDRKKLGEVNYTWGTAGRKPWTHVHRRDSIEERNVG